MAHQIFYANDSPGTQETDPRDDSSCNSAGVDLNPVRLRQGLRLFSHASRADHDHGRSQADENMGAKAGRPPSEFPFQSNGAAEQDSEKKL
jgi:hypothetical protein